MGTNCNVCSNKCWGVEGQDGSCCTLENRDWIMGPIMDGHEFIENLSKKLGEPVNYDDVFIKFEEGKNLFPDKPSWQHEISYPAFRIQIDNKKLPCIFYNTEEKQCVVYDVRPEVCRNYECDYYSVIKSINKVKNSLENNN
jgi:Fe-S-cluster containining protein